MEDSYIASTHALGSLQAVARNTSCSVRGEGSGETPRWGFGCWSSSSSVADITATLQPQQRAQLRDTIALLVHSARVEEAMGSPDVRVRGPMCVCAPCICYCDSGLNSCSVHQVAAQSLEQAAALATAREWVWVYQRLASW